MEAGEIGGAMGTAIADRATWLRPVAHVSVSGAGVLVRAEATRDRARQTRLRSIGLKDQSRRLRRGITGVVLGLFTGPPMQPTDPGFGPGTVLVVDDDDAVRETLVALITLAGYRVIEAADGEEALHILHTETVDIMVMDLRMPRRDGVSVLRDLPLRPPVVIVHTAATDDAADLETSILGAKVFTSLGKPVSPPVLLATISEAIGHGSRTQSPPPTDE